MKIPKKITPDRIRDSIVEVRYSSELPYELIIGMFFSALDNSFHYTNRPLEAKPTSEAPLINNNLTLRLGSHNLFYNDLIKIQLQPGTIIFNCLNEYVSWSIYREQIKTVLSQLSSTDVFIEFTRIGVRFISDYPETNLDDCVKFNFSFGMESIESEQYSFKSEFKSEEIRVILNLGHSIPRQIGEKGMIPTSTIDVDAILNLSGTRNFEELIPLIDRVHDKEKEMFFTILKDDFLESLNPEY